MSVSHHPSEATLTLHAAGGLSEGAAMVVGGHLDACPACRRAVAMMEAVGGALVEDMSPAAMAPDALDRALAGLDRPEAAPPAPPKPGPRRWLAPGVWLTPEPVRGPAGERAYRLQVPPGRTLPKHSHNGAEFVLVLAGCFMDVAQLYQAGDFAESGPEHEHHPKVVGDEPCVCLIWTEAPIRMRSPLGKVLQPWLGI